MEKEKLKEKLKARIEEKKMYRSDKKTQNAIVDKYCKDLGINRKEIEKIASKIKK